MGITIGSGIFRKPQTLAGLVPDAVVILSLWTAFGLISLCGALALAELASMLPRTGGPYVFLHAAYGDAAAFVFGWLYLLVATPAAIGALATFFAELLLGLGGLEPRGAGGAFPPLASVTIVVLAAVEPAGDAPGNRRPGDADASSRWRPSSLVVAAAVVAGGSFAHLAERSRTGIAADALGRAAASVIWAYDGWIAVSMIAGEVVARGEADAAHRGGGHARDRAPVPRGERRRTSTPCPWRPWRRPPRACPSGSRRGPWGPPGAALISALILCSVFGALNGNILAKPRVSFALSRDGLTFGFLGRAHPRWSTPYAAILIQCAVAVVLVWLLRDFDRLTTYYVVVEWAALLFAVGAVFVLRRRRPEAPRPFRTPGYPLVPAVFLLGTLAGLGAIVWGEIDQPIPNYSPVWGLLLSLAGFPAYALWRRRKC